MRVVIQCVDKPAHEAVRAANRDAHLAHIKAQGERVVFAGPLLTPDGEGMVGSLLIMDFDTLADAHAFTDADPYNKAGLFERVEVRPVKQVLPGQG